MDLGGYIRSRSANSMIATRAIRTNNVILPPSSGIEASNPAGWLNTDMTEMDATRRHIPLQPARATNAPVAGAPAVAGGPLQSVPQMMVDGGRVEPVVDAAQRAQSAKAVSFKTNDTAGAIAEDTKKHHNGLGVPKKKKDLSKYGGLSIGRAATKPSVGPAVASLIDRWASADQLEAERQIFRRASELYRRGYHKSSSLNVIIPPDYQAKAASASGNTLVGYTDAEVSGGQPPESTPAEVMNKASGYMVGKFSEPIQAAHEATAARQPASTVSGVLFPVGTQPGYAQAVGYAADSTASADTIGAAEAVRMQSITDPNGIVSNTTRKTRAVASRANAKLDPKAAPNAPTGGVMISVKPSSPAPTPEQEAAKGAMEDAVGDVSQGGVPGSSAGKVVGVAFSGKSSEPTEAPAEEVSVEPIGKSSMFRNLKPVTSGGKKR